MPTLNNKYTTNNLAFLFTDSTALQLNLRNTVTKHMITLSFDYKRNLQHDIELIQFSHKNDINSIAIQKYKHILTFSCFNILRSNFIYTIMYEFFPTTSSHSVLYNLPNTTPVYYSCL